MPESPPPQIDLCEFTKYLVFQQFYYGGDQIVGRAKDITETIPGVGQLLELFFNRVYQITRVLDKQNYMDFLQKFNLLVYPVSIQVISESYLLTVKMLETDLDTQLFLNFTLGAALTEMHQIAFSKIEQKIMGLLLQNGIKKNTNSIKSISSTNLREIWLDRLKSFYGKNDKRISILYSLGYLQSIAKSMDDKPILKYTQNLIRKYTREVATSLRAEYEKIPVSLSKTV